tara:strand:- start:22 stop:651 length:630 start_codon:yes stop_codon:yes gene_type:complete
MKNVVGICGLIGHGKDTAAGFLIEQGYQRISFAGVLKDACANIFSWDRILLEGNTKESRVWRETVDEWWSDRLGIENFTPRYALQYIGTNVFRKHFHPDIWVAACERQIEIAEKNVVISDCRFFNELGIIKKLGGTTAVVWRNEKPLWWATACGINTTNTNNNPNNSMEVVFPDVHPSEWSWAGWQFDHTIENTGTLEDLQSRTLEVFS